MIIHYNWVAPCELRCPTLSHQREEEGEGGEGPVGEGVAVGVVTLGEEGMEVTHRGDQGEDHAMNG